MPTALETAPTVNRVTIPMPAEIEAELEELKKRTTSLRALLKVSKEAYGVADADAE